VCGEFSYIATFTYWYCKQYPENILIRSALIIPAILQQHCKRHNNIIASICVVWGSLVTSRRSHIVYLYIQHSWNTDPYNTDYSSDITSQQRCNNITNVTTILLYICMLYAESRYIATFTSCKLTGCLPGAFRVIDCRCRDRWCQLSSSIIALREDSACVQLTRRHGDGWQCFRSLRHRRIGLRCLLTNGYPAERAEASLSLSLLSLSLAGKTRIICAGRVGTRARFPTPLSTCERELYSLTCWKLHWKVWGRETEVRPRNFYLHNF